MKTLIKTKLLEGKYAEIREYHLFKVPIKLIYCKAKDYKLCSHEQEGYMTFTLEQQKKGRITNTQKSKFYPYSYYKLYKFLWKPKYQVIEESPDLFQAMSKMAQTKQWEELRERLHRK